MSGNKWNSLSAEQTTQWGEALGRIIEPGHTVSLVGEMGAGKTHFTRALGRGLGTDDQVVSPTFLFMVEYPGRVPLRHLDAYFTEKESAYMEEAASEIFDGSAAVVVEWGDRVEGFLPPDRLEIRLALQEEHSREIQAIAHGPQSQYLLQRWAEFIDK